MSESPMEQAYRLRLEEARRELTDDGWEVVSADQLADVLWPTPLSGLAPDIVARKGRELLVGEVKSRNSRELGDLNGLANAIATVPHARLEVFWLGDEPESDPARDLIREYVAEAATLLRSGHSKAAVATAWSALEGALIYYAAESRASLPPGERPAPQQAWSLLSQLYSLGYISDADYDRLHELRKQRNAAVHFTGEEAPDPADIEYALDIVDRMLSGRYTTGDLVWARESARRPGSVSPLPVTWQHFPKRWLTCGFTSHGFSSAPACFHALAELRWNWQISGRRWRSCKGVT